ncbi:AraC family transcriptional regulator [Reticulibacter mediterranei]|uniref:AraC family transcriptional regulator n=1 Tax=Reticulibacter mediterranei TaxID=2778369 RepID=A0A8J3MZJ9_9CHLR|nr:AraC family transcriptional regulator [Reticulibacter mediterranei]GHO90533.1 AraC family transcriptional regulator [Reticulibacter mediterranei]
MFMKRDVLSSRSTLTTEIYIPTLPILSSVPMGWEGMIAQIYNEPVEVESATIPAVSDLSLIMVTHGAVSLETRDGGSYSSWRASHISVGDWFLLPGGTAVEFRWRDKDLSSGPLQTLRLHLSTDLIQRIAEQLTDHDPTHMELVERSGFQDPLLAQIGFALHKELQSPIPGGKLYAETATQMLAVHLLRSYLTTDISIKEPPANFTRQQVKRVVEYIQDHLDQNLSLETLAQQQGFSAYHFARLFRQATGESPHQFVLNKRIEAAQHLLKKKDLPLAQVALAVGFPNQSHFTQVFKNRVGLTPLRYRQDHQSKAHFEYR